MLIAGIDPGTTTGVALLDLDGKLVAWKSSREFSRSDVSRYIITSGKPLVIATDVTPAPALVEKVASTFGAELFVPDHDLGQEEKEGLIDDLETEDMDSHAQDALAAAVRAYRNYRDTITKATERVREADLEAFRQQVLEETVTGTQSVAAAIDDLRKVDEAEGEETIEHAEPVDWERIAKKYRQQYQQKEKEAKRLREHQQQLQKENKVLAEENEALQAEQRQEALRDKTVQKWKQKAENRMKRIHKLENRVSELENRLERYRMALDFLHSGEELISICSSEEELQELEDSIAFIRKNLRTEPPEPLKIAIVEKEKDRKFYREQGIQAITYHTLRGLKLEDYYIVDEQMLLDEVEEETSGFIDWLEDYRKRDERAH